MSDNNSEQETIDYKMQLQEQMNAWNNLDEGEQQKYEKLHEDLETEDAEDEMALAVITAHLREHNSNKNNPAYLVRGADLMCNCGTNKRQMNLSPCHGVYIKSHAVVHELDCIQGNEENITWFGVCNCDEKPDTEEIKLINDNGEECHGNKCKPYIIGKWLESYEGTRIVDFSKKEESMDNLVGCNTITMDSFLVCKYGGIIMPINSGQDREICQSEFEGETDEVRKEAFERVTGRVGQCREEIDGESGCDELLHQYVEQNEGDVNSVHGSNFNNYDAGNATDESGSETIEDILIQNCKYNWMKENLPSTEYATEEFIKRTIEIANDLNVEPDDLFAVMAYESWFNPQAKNPGSTATGLIQFLASTAKGLETTVEDLANMSAVEQLDYVYKYYEPYTGKLNDVYDVYMVTLCPKAVGKPNDYVLYELGTESYTKNQGLDSNNDGKITKEEATEAIIQRREQFIWEE